MIIKEIHEVTIIEEPIFEAESSFLNLKIGIYKIIKKWKKTK
jgi:hypothetical protein